MNYARIPGRQLGNAEILEFWGDADGPGGEYILDTACQVAPGVVVNGGYWSGQYVIRLSNGEVFGNVPDDSAPEDFGRLTYWGKDFTEDQLRGLLVDFIVDNHLEVFIAFALHFRADKFAEYAEELVKCQQKFRVEWNQIDRLQRDAVGVELARRSLPYRIVKGFFHDPFQPKFRGLLEQVVNEKQFGSVYLFASE